jgi:hypothetical protein
MGWSVGLRPHKKGTQMMMSTKITTKTEHLFKALVILAMLASLLAVLAVRPAHADGEFIFRVNAIADFPDLNPGDGVCDVTFSTENTCTLRAAIQETNATPELDIIHFAIPETFRDPGSGVATLSPAKELPTITEPVVIEGYSQPGASVNTATKGTNAEPKIVLSGANIPPFSDDVSGLTVSGGGTIIKGLVINGFKGDQFDFGGTGIELLNVAGNTGNVISGNFIGTNATGTTAVSNQGTGIVTFFNSTNNTIGGTTTVDRNLISGNFISGVSLNSSNNEVQNNLIGTDKSGTKDLGNAFNGVGVSKSGNTIGGGSPNTIAFNSARGVDISASINTSSVVNRVLSNSIFSNGELGIDLGRDGVSPNDTGDVDSGPNNLQNFPVISSAKTSSTATILKAKLNGQGNTPYIVQFFSNPSGGDQGKTFIGQKTIITDASGNVSFTLNPNKKVAAGRTITATATRNAFNIPGDTSEFSAPRKVVAS